MVSAFGYSLISVKPSTPGTCPRIASYGLEARLKRRIRLKITVRAIPGNTPTVATPRVVAMERTNSDRLISRNFHTLLKSKSDAPARTNTAPSEAVGIYASGPVKTVRTDPMTKAAANPLTCDRPPARSLIAVRESVPAIGKPLERPEVTLAKPRAMNSLSGATSYPFFTAKLFADAIDPQKQIKTMPAAFGRRRTASEIKLAGKCGHKNPAGTEPN